MKIRPLILLVILCSQILAPLGIWGADISNEAVLNVNCTLQLESTCKDKGDEDQKISCCSKDTIQDDTIKDGKCDHDDEQKSNCCGDDCDCKCCHTIHNSNVQFHINSISILECYTMAFNSRATFNYQKPFSKDFIGNLLNPPKVH